MKDVQDNIYGPPRRRVYHGSYGPDDVAPWVGDIEEFREPEGEDAMAEALGTARQVDDVAGMPPVGDGDKPRKEGGAGVTPGSSYDFGEYGKFRLGEGDRVNPQEWRDSLGEDTKAIFDDAFRQATGYNYDTWRGMTEQGYAQSINLGQVTDITKRMTNPGYRVETPVIRNDFDYHDPGLYEKPVVNAIKQKLNYPVASILQFGDDWRKASTVQEMLALELNSPHYYLHGQLLDAAAMVHFGVTDIEQWNSMKDNQILLMSQKDIRGILELVTPPNMIPWSTPSQQRIDQEWAFQDAYQALYPEDGGFMARRIVAGEIASSLPWVPDATEKRP